MDDLLKLFLSANSKFLENDLELITSDVSERTLCGALMLHLHNELKNTPYARYYVDVEYNRNYGEIKKIINKEEKILRIVCDLIVHSRGHETQDNLIAIELKKSNGNTSAKTKDKERLMALTTPIDDDNIWSYDGKSLPEYVCGYIVGIYYEINRINRSIYIEIFSRGQRIDTMQIQF